MISLISPVDRDYLAGIGAPDGAFEIFTNGVNLTNLPFLGPGQSKNIIFIGNMRTIPNLDACRFMATEVLPLIRKHTDVRFKIIGEAPSAAFDEFQRYEAVTMVGRVDSISKAADGAFASVCPMRFGAGVQNKVLEYMSLGIPCVTTSVGLEGIGATPSKEVVVADKPEDMANAVLQILKDPIFAKNLSLAARNFVERQHTWPPIQKAYRDCLSRLIER
jgi:glycosyltransferase involved in cell wall biosynthesis